MENKETRQMNPGSIENAPISFWLKQVRKENNGVCNSKYVLFWAEKIGLKLNKEEKFILEKHYGKYAMKKYENYIRGDCEVGGTTFEEVLRYKRLQEIELGELPR